MHFEALEHRRLFAANGCQAIAPPESAIDQLPWQNPVLPLDVNHDEHIAPVDALVLVNDLNQYGPRALSAAAPVARLVDHLFLDVNGDDFVSPLDPLTIINHLNGGQGSGSDATNDSLDHASTPKHSTPCELDLPLLAPRTVKTNTIDTVTLPETTTAGVSITYAAEANHLAPHSLTVQVVDNRLTITSGSSTAVELPVTITATADGQRSSATILLNVVDNFAPVISPLADIELRSGETHAFTIEVTDADGDRLDVNASVDSVAARAFEFKSQWKLAARDAFPAFDNSLKAGEKWILSRSGGWWFILPNGEVHRSNGRNGGAATVASSSILLETVLDPSYHADLNRLLDAERTPIAVSLENGHVSLTTVEGYAGEFDVLVSASDKTSVSTAKIHVKVAAPSHLDPSTHISPQDGTVWKVDGSVLFRNGTPYLNAVSKFAMYANGDLLTDGREFGQTRDWLGSLPSAIRHLARGEWKTYEGLSRFHITPTGDTFLWGSTFERLEETGRTVLVNNVAMVVPSGADIYVLSRDGVLERMNATHRAVLSDRVGAIAVTDGRVVLNKFDGTRDELMVRGDIEGFAREAAEHDPRFSEHAATQGQKKSYGVIGRTNVPGTIDIDRRVSSAVGRVLVTERAPGKWQFNGSGTVLDFGGNRYVLTAAHLVERAENQLFDKSQLAFDTQPSVIGGASPEAITVEAVWGREWFGGRDLALLRLSRPLEGVVGATLPTGTNAPGDQVLIMGYGLNNSGSDGVLTYGRATIDQIRTEDYVSRREDGTTTTHRGPFLVNEYRAGEAAANRGDSGGPDFTIVQRRATDGQVLYVPHLMGVHSFLASDEETTQVGDHTYSIQVTRDVVTTIQELVGPPTLAADIILKVIDDGDGWLAGAGEWSMNLRVNNVQWSIDRTYDGQPYDTLKTVPVTPGGRLDIAFDGWERDSGFLDGNDRIAPLAASIDIPERLVAEVYSLLGEKSGDTAYRLYVQFRYAWR